jgi:hypothetical protein
MDEFLKAFWPNFASTVLGLVLGLPLALWTNRLIISHGERLKRAEEQQRLTKALDTLTRALLFNRERLQTFAQKINNSLAPFDVAIDYSAWEASRSEITPYLRDPELQQRIAYHFSRLASVAKLNDMYLHYAAGIGAALGGSENTRDALRKYLTQVVSHLDNEANELVELIKKVEK